MRYTNMVFNLLPPFGNKKQMENVGQYRAVDIEKDATDDTFLKSLFSLPFFTNTGMFFRSCMHPDVNTSVTNKMDFGYKNSNRMKKSIYHPMPDIPHAKFFHRRIIGHQ